jgi:hypothetical protein
MTLQVPFEDFASAAQRFEIKEAYLLPEAQFLAVSGCNVSVGITLLSQTSKTVEEAKHALEIKDLAVFRGIWSEHRVPMEDDSPDLFVAAVSYSSGQPMPGLWVDAFANEPTHVEVLEAIYKEFKQTGEMPDISIEEFINSAKPNVLVLSQARLSSFLDAKLAPQADGGENYPPVNSSSNVSSEA